MYNGYESYERKEPRNSLAMDRSFYRSSVCACYGRSLAVIVLTKRAD